MSSQARHPREETLALLAGGDLPLLDRLRAAAHVRVCSACAAAVNGYKRLRTDTAALGQDPDPADWARLEAEMRANIRLGLAAGAAVRLELPAPPSSRPDWRWAAMAASLAFVFGAGVWLDRHPAPSQTGIAANFPQALVETRSQGLALRASGAELELKGPEGSAALRSVSWDGSANARYFDGNTGQVTIHRVAWEDSDAQ